MSNRDITSELAEAFAPGILNSLQDFWFSHLADQTHILVPSTKDIDVWFVDKSDEFDDSCRFVPFLNQHIGDIASRISQLTQSPAQNSEKYSTSLSHINTAPMKSS